MVNKIQVSLLIIIQSKIFPGKSAMPSVQMCNFICKQRQEQIFPGLFLISNWSLLYLKSTFDTVPLAPNPRSRNLLQHEPGVDNQPAGEKSTLEADQQDQGRGR